MELWRIRVEADDEPGQLAAIAHALAASGANIMSLDVHAIDAHRVADDLVVAAGGSLDESVLGGVLAPLDARLVDVRRADAHELVDATTRALAAAAGLVRSGVDLDGLGAAIAQAVQCELAYVRPAVEGLALTDLEARALAEGRPVRGRELVKRVPSGGSGAWVLAVPSVLHGRPHVAVAARRSPRFSFTETARIRALVGVAEAVVGASAPRHEDGSVVRLPDGGEVVLRPLRASDEGAMVRLHRRCSRITLQRRYFSSMQAVPPTLLRLLLDVDGIERVGFAAAVGSELVGVAHLTGLTDDADDRAAEVAVLVEDGHHRRGIGAVLLDACAREATARGVRALTAVCLADNDAFPALVARCGYQASPHREDGQLVLTFPLRRQRIDAGSAGTDRRSHAARDHRLWWPR